MTRRGSTPFLQEIFKSVLLVELSKSLVDNTWEQYDLPTTDQTSWEDWKLVADVLKANGFVRARFTVVSEGKTGLEAYVPKSSNPEEVMAFGFIELSTHSRRRTFHKGHLQAATGGKLISARTSFELELDNVLGDLILEPVIVATSELAGPKGHIGVTTGTIIGTTNVIRIREKNPVGPLGDIFDYQWISFATSDHRAEGELFDIDLFADGEKPVLYLNEDVEHFHGIMNTPDNRSGKASRKLLARRTLDSAVAVEVMTQCLATVLQKISSLAADRREEDAEEDEFGSIFYELTVHEQSIVEGWRNFLGVTHAHENGYSVCAEISALSPSAVSNHLSSSMPRWIRSQVEIENAAARIINNGLQADESEDAG
jgi:hypothetical protein